MTTTSRVRVKICGVTSPADAAAVARLGADAIGVNFYADSPRCISPATADDIAAVLPPFVEPIALFIKNTIDEVLTQAARFPWLRTLQWHGDELPPPGALSRYRCVVGVPIRDRHSLDRVQSYLAECQGIGWLPTALLVDAFVPGKYGGTGQTAPWELLRDFHPPVPVILAGGLTPENVAEAVRVVRPYAVDVASGVESAPGRKDLEKVRRFLANVTAAH